MRSRFAEKRANKSQNADRISPFHVARTKIRSARIGIGIGGALSVGAFALALLSLFFQHPQPSLILPSIAAIVLCVVLDAACLSMQAILSAAEDQHKMLALLTTANQHLLALRVNQAAEETST